METSERAMKLLGSGLSPTVVASTIGVTDSYISQLMADSDFAAKVVELRFQTLQASSERDKKYDELEDTLLERLKDVLPYMVKPREVLDALTKVNAAKRRGQTSPDVGAVTSQIVNLQIPIVLQQKFTVSSDNHIIQVGEQELSTISAQGFKRLLEQEGRGGAKNGESHEITDLAIRTPVAARG